MLFQLALLPGLLSSFNSLLTHPFSKAEVNFTYFLINFIAVCVIFREFLHGSLKQAGAHPWMLCRAVFFGLAAYYLSIYLLNTAIARICPGFSNVNDSSIASLAHGSFYLTAAGTVLLVPLTEECLFRGLIFRAIAGNSRAAAYLVSIAAFASVHILSYIGSSSALTLLLCFLQYVPAALWLAWSYDESGTILAPVLMHAVINAAAISSMR